MISSIVNFVLQEKKYLYLLPKNARLLVISYFIQGIAYILIDIFISAYIWRIKGEVFSVALYNLGNFIMLPIIFYFNGILLKKIKITVLYFFGSCTAALGAICVVFFPQLNSIYYLLYGALYGIGNGLYWANRNFLTLQETESKNRNYFVGLNFTFDTISNILIPFIFGWFIVLSNNIHLFSIDQSYKILILFSFLLLFSAGLIVLNTQFKSPQDLRLIINRITKRWAFVRIFTISIGIFDGTTYFLPTLIILIKLGHEGILGTINSILSIATVGMLYYYSRNAKIQHQKPLYKYSVIVGFLAAIIFGVFYNRISTFIFIIINSLALNFMWLTFNPLIMDIIDEEVINDKQSRYSLIADQELFLNIGRYISILILALMLLYFGQQNTVRFTPFIIFLFQIILLIFSWKKIERSEKNVVGY